MLPDSNSPVRREPVDMSKTRGRPASEVPLRVSERPGLLLCATGNCGRPRHSPDTSESGQSRSPALAGIIGARRACTALTISALSMPCS
jgi:hypothetical protein